MDTNGHAGGTIAQRLSFGAVPAFFVAFALAMGFAAFTDHVWEDYYITYRASRNLAEGNGLVFTAGERLHTFTSPLGVLLPAAAFGLTGNTSDDVALWIFRVWCAAAFGGAAALVVAIGRRLRQARMAIVAGVALLALDAKSLDFTINGMETAWMLLFLAYAFGAHLRIESKTWIHLGMAWAGLMWTRPDSFIYVGLIAAGFWLFNDEAESGASRKRMLGVFVRAGILTTVLYGPWLAWAAWYYGSPVPHTIAAKGSIGSGRTVWEFVATAARLPYLAWTGGATLESTFLPSYYVMGGWPAWWVWASRAVATMCAMLWVVPRLRREARVASFAFFGAHVYLSFFPYFPFPWYVPSTTLLAILSIGGGLAQLFGRRKVTEDGAEKCHALYDTFAKWAGVGVVVVAVVGAGWVTWNVARQVEAQQRIVETGTRRAIGEWLKANAAEGDAVFMEPLGYIGFFSGLKTFDYPGMSSLEMVRARKAVGEEWGRLIFELQPRWVVLRPFEVERIERANPGMLGEHYEVARVFDREAEVRTLDVRGRPYLEHDARFTVFRMVRPFGFPTEIREIEVPFPVTYQMVDDVNLGLMHAPSRMTVRVPTLAKTVSGHFGLMPAAIEEPGATDGAVFRIVLRSGGETRVMMERTLRPVEEERDRGVQAYRFELPRERAAEAELVFEIEEGGNGAKDWTCWDVPDFR
jgi:hypothetical protein